MVAESEPKATTTSDHVSAALSRTVMVSLTGPNTLPIGFHPDDRLGASLEWFDRTALELRLVPLVEVRGQDSLWRLEHGDRFVPDAVLAGTLFGDMRLDGLDSRGDLIRRQGIEGVGRGRRQAEFGRQRVDERLYDGHGRGWGG